MTRFGSILIVLAFSAASAPGQSHIGIAGGSSSSVQRHGGFAVQQHRGLIGLSGPPLRENARHRRFGRNAFFYGGWPYWPSGDEESYEPEPVVVEAPAPTAVPSPQMKPEAPIEPAMYELRQSHWVRVNFGEGTASSTVPLSESTAPPPPKELPPAILVYRDGHTEELSSYSIIGVTIYAKADYWSSGTWTRKIPISGLDIPATIKQNQQRGVDFELPSGPNEVILRP